MAQLLTPIVVMSAACSTPCEVQVRWSFVDGESFVWGLTIDPELNI